MFQTWERLGNVHDLDRALTLLQQAAHDRLVLHRVERARRVDETTADLQELQTTLKDATLQAGEMNGESVLDAKEMIAS